MSHAPPYDINAPGAGIGKVTFALPGFIFTILIRYTACTDDDQYPPHSAPNQASQGMSNFVDGSGPIFSMYLGMATECDKKMVENWKADADRTLIFVGLYLLISFFTLTQWL